VFPERQEAGRPDAHKKCPRPRIAQGFEHSVVNMFLIPTGMMMGAKVTISEWWLWNQIPVTLGNLLGGGVFTGIALYLTHKPRAAAPAPLAAATRVPAE
jgi:formate transporter